MADRDIDAKPQAKDSPAQELTPGRQVHIVIVNWNSRHWLANCLASIEAFGGDRVGRIVVVDNGSTDGSADAEFTNLPYTVVQTGTNLGFARGCNIGATGAEDAYLLFLNPDAALHEGSLRTVLDFMESPSATDVGVCGIRLVGQDNLTQHITCPFPSPWTFLTYRLLNAGFDHESSRPVDHVIGAFYLIRRDLFERLGGFDERFFVYLEDLDLSKRVWGAGKQVYYLAGATAFHKEGGTSENVKAERLFYANTSRILYALKHFSPLWAAAIIAETLVIEPLMRLVRAALRGSAREAWDTLRGYAWLWRDLPRTLATAMQHGRQPVCMASDQPLEAPRQHDVSPSEPLPRLNRDSAQ